MRIFFLQKTLSSTCHLPPALSVSTHPSAGTASHRLKSKGIDGYCNQMSLCPKAQRGPTSEKT